MKQHQALIVTAVTLLLSGGITAALAEPAPADHAMMHHNPAAQVAENQMTHEGHGVIKAINLKDSKVQIAHEAIPALQWPPMTMWIALHAPLPGKIKVGDEVKFELKQLDGKSWVISKIDPK